MHIARRLLALVGLVLILTTGVQALRSPLAPNGADGCVSYVYLDPATGHFQISCSGTSCEVIPTICSVITAGVPGATFTYCGCANDPVPTPICCYPALNQYGNPTHNGFCKGDVIPADHCPAGDCKARKIPGSEPEQWTASCL